MNTGEKECTTPGCDSPADTEGDAEDGLCFACRLGKRMIKGWQKKKKVWEWAYMKILNEENLRKLTRCSKNGEASNVPNTQQSSSAVEKIETKSEKSVVVALKKPRRTKPTKQQGCELVTCRKNVRLFGFRCRCGGTFCIVHRCGETHFCKVDYRAMGAKDIVKNYSRVVAKNIRKI